MHFIEATGKIDLKGVFLNYSNKQCLH